MGYHTPYLPGMHLYWAKKRTEKKVSGKELAGIRQFLGGMLDFDELGRRPRRGENSRSRIFDRPTVFILFLLQILSGLTCGHTVKLAQGARIAKKSGRISSSSSAYCQARDRLELPVLKRIFRKLSDSLLSRGSGSWRGLGVLVVDGTGLDMPDTPRNRKAYPPRGERTAGTSFPQLNLVAVFELFSGVAINWKSGNKHWGEQSLWKSLMLKIKMSATVILGDCYYCSFGNIATILDCGGHCIFPLERSVNMKKLKKLGKGEWNVRLRKPSARAKTWTTRQWKMFPAYIDLRLIERTICSPGFRPRKLRLLTTLLDCGKYPADEVAGLQKRRWEVELRLRDIKTAMGMNHLSCKTPTMVAKEIAMFMTAYNLVRLMMAEAAPVSGGDNAKLSFSSALAQTEEWARMSLLRKPAMSRRKLMELFFDTLSEVTNPSRPGRSEPRVVKRRDQRFPKMKQPRKTYATYRKAA